MMLRGASAHLGAPAVRSTGQGRPRPIPSPVAPPATIADRR